MNCKGKLAILSLWNSVLFWIETRVPVSMLQGGALNSNGTRFLFDPPSALAYVIQN